MNGLELFQRGADAQRPVNYGFALHREWRKLGHQSGCTEVAMESVNMKTVLF
jgi:hypothetical protein